MQKVAAAFSALLLAGCASSGQVEERDRSEPGGVPEIFDYEYEYSGQLEGTTVSGRVSFEQVGDGDIRYTMMREGAPAPCRDYVRSPTAPRVRVSCHGLTVDFTRTGEWTSRPYATLRTTRLGQQRECTEWRVDERTRRRVCANWELVSVEQPVTLRGTIDMERVGGAG